MVGSFLKTIPLPGGMSLPCSVELWGHYYMVCSLGDASDGNSNGAIGIQPCRQGFCCRYTSAPCRDSLLARRASEGAAESRGRRARGQDELVSLLEIAKLLGDQGWHHPHDAVCLTARFAS